jgi:hypothetical protein
MLRRTALRSRWSRRVRAVLRSGHHLQSNRGYSMSMKPDWAGSCETLHRDDVRPGNGTHVK